MNVSKYLLCVVAVMVATEAVMAGRKKVSDHVTSRKEDARPGGLWPDTMSFVCMGRTKRPKHFCDNCLDKPGVRSHAFLCDVCHTKCSTCKGFDINKCHPVSWTP